MDLNFSVVLRKNNLILPIFGYGFSVAHFGEELLGIKRSFNFLPHKAPFILFHKAALSPNEDQPINGIERRSKAAAQATQPRSAAPAAATHHRANSPRHPRHVVETLAIPSLTSFTFFVELRKLG
jgi:hypothetical protein